MVDHAGQARRLADYIVSLELGFSRQQDASVVGGYGEGFDVANGSFEGTARDGYGGFGWRYFEDGVERVMDSAGAADRFPRRSGDEEGIHKRTLPQCHSRIAQRVRR